MAWPNHDLNLAQLQPQINAAGVMDVLPLAKLAQLLITGADAMPASTTIQPNVNLWRENSTKLQSADQLLLSSFA